MSNGSVMSYENAQHGIFHKGELSVSARSHRLTCIFETSNLAGVKRALVWWITVCLLYSCKLTESVWSVSVEPGNASGGWLDHYRWTRKKVCFLTLVNQVNGPLGGRSMVPNGLIREEEVDDGKGIRWPTFSPPLQPLVRPRTHKSPGSQPGHIYSASRTSALALQGQRWNLKFMSLQFSVETVRKLRNGKVFNSKNTCILRRTRLKCIKNMHDN